MTVYSNPLSDCVAAMLAAGIPVTVLATGPSNVPGIDAVPTYGPNATAAQIAQGAAIIAGFNWAPIPLPDTVALQLAIAQDKTIPVAALMQFINYAGVVSQTTYQTLPILKALWAAAVAEYGQQGGPFYGNCTDGTPIVQKIEGYFAAYNCPIV